LSSEQSTAGSRLSALTICTTCADGQGQALLEAVENEALARDWALPVQGQACMGACKQGCTAALQGLGKHSYLFSQLTPDAACVDALLAVAAQHAEPGDGLLAWDRRPDRLKSGLVARLPPLR
jgi:predicted metal-binding protein